MSVTAGNEAACSLAAVWTGHVASNRTAVFYAHAYAPLETPSSST
jgi:hypothetical protein